LLLSLLRAADSIDILIRIRRLGISPVFSCSAEKIPLQADLIPLLGRVAEFASDSNKINHLQGRIRPSKGLNGRFLVFFPV
jgi:hypothetical protein